MKYTQIELFTLSRSPKGLMDYWRKSLAQWPVDVFQWRHDRNTTGWSMSTGGFTFARLLFSEGKISRKTFKRFWKFNRRVVRWNAFNVEGGAK